MTAAEFYRTSSRTCIAAVCRRAGTTPGYFRLLAYGTRKPSPRLAKKLEKASNKVMTAAELRPDIVEMMK